MTRNRATTNEGGRAANGDGTAWYDRTRDRWVARTVVRGRPHSRTGKTEAAARRRLEDEVLRPVREGGRPSSTTTLAAWTDLYFARVRSKTIDRQTARIEAGHMRLHILPTLGSTRLKDLDVDEVEKTLAAARNVKTGRPLSRATLIRVRSVFAAVLQEAVRRRILTFNAAELVTLDGIEDMAAQVARQVLSVDELERLLDGIVEAERFGPYFVLLADTAMRPGEAAALRWTDVDLVRRTVTVAGTRRADGGKEVRSNRTKTAKSRRTLRISEATVEALKVEKVRATERRLRAKVWTDRDGLVFPTRTGKVVRGRSVRRALERICAERGVRPIVPYGFRHTRLTLLVRSNRYPTQVLVDFAGHKDSRMIETVYLHQEDGFVVDVQGDAGGAVSDVG